MSKREELPIPPVAKKAAEAHEIIRAWIAEEGLHCSLSVDNWPDNESVGWGILLSDVVRHVADALLQLKGIERDETIRQIRITLNKELDHPTAEAKGEIV